MSKRGAHACLGFAFALAVVMAIGELALRIAPPRTIQPYLGDVDTRGGPFRNDELFGVQYRSWQSYVEECKPRSDASKSWAMFGNSFVQAPGMLADTARQQLKNRKIFNLGRNENLFVRAAQIAMLLDHGQRPERIFFVLLPLDSIHLANHGRSQMHVNEHGALAYDPRSPSFGASILKSRLFLTGWVRTDSQHNIPRFHAGEVTSRMNPILENEFRILLNGIASKTKPLHIPVTLILLPNYEQIVKGAGFAFQDSLALIGRDSGMDVLDIRDPLINHTDKPTLFIPDKHFSESGNRIILSQIVHHLNLHGEANDIRE